MLLYRWPLLRCEQRTRNSRLNRMTNLASIGANLIEALRGIAKGSGRHDRVPFTRADSTKDFGRTVTIGEALTAASQHLPVTTASPRMNSSSLMPRAPSSE